MNGTLLILDDERSIRTAVAKYFVLRGWQVDTAEDVDGALGKLAEHEYDAVLADLRLAGPGDTSGLEVVEELNRRSPRTRVIVLTAYGSPEIEREAAACGAHAFLLKPQPLGEVAEVLGRLLGSPAYSNRNSRPGRSNGSSGL